MAYICNKVARQLFIAKQLFEPRDLSMYTKEQLALATLAIREDSPSSGTCGISQVNEVHPRVKAIFDIQEPEVAKTTYNFPFKLFEKILSGIKGCNQDAILSLLCDSTSNATSLSTRNYSTSNQNPYQTIYGPGGLPLPFPQEQYPMHPGWMNPHAPEPLPQRPVYQQQQQSSPLLKKKAEPLTPENKYP